MGGTVAYPKKTVRNYHYCLTVIAEENITLNIILFIYLTLPCHLNFKKPGSRNPFVNLQLYC